MNKKQGVKALYIRIPADLHEMLAKLAIDTGLSSQEIIVRYLKYLKKFHAKKREPLNDKRKGDFSLDAGESE